MHNQATSSASDSRWSRFSSACVRAFHAYAGWLVSISWLRFFMLSLLLIIAMAIVQDVPPFSWTYSGTIADEDALKMPKASRPSAVPGSAPKGGQGQSRHGAGEGVDISIDERGVRITTRAAAPPLPAAPASAPDRAVSDAAAPEATPALPGVTITLPPGSYADDVRAAIDEVREQLAAPRVRIRKYGEPLVPLAMLFILLSIVIKVTYKGTVQAEAKAAQATEVAEAESLKRQVIEARMAVMQAQVEPHFLFNTLASIDHLIETDPARASKMQKDLIALLRTTMPTMREANAQATRDLGRELAVIRPYLEILKVRMEDRLQTEVRVSEGLLSAEFPPMMLQSLVENAIKHGLEPKADGGQLTVSAEIIHGKLAVTVADTGLGFGKAATTGTGIGLSNIRERLALLYGNKASLSVTQPPGGGTSVTITLPYVAHHEAGPVA